MSICSRTLLCAALITALPMPVAAEDDAARLRARVAEGKLRRERLDAAAALGHEPARAARGMLEPGAADPDVLTALLKLEPEGRGRLAMVGLRRAVEVAPADTRKAMLAAAERYLAAAAPRDPAALQAAQKADQAEFKAALDEKVKHPPSYEGMTEEAALQAVAAEERGTAAHELGKQAVRLLLDVLGEKPTTDEKAAKRALGEVLKGIGDLEERAPPPAPSPEVAKEIAEGLAASGHGVKPSPALEAYQEELRVFQKGERTRARVALLERLREAMLPWLLGP